MSKSLIVTGDPSGQTFSDNTTGYSPVCGALLASFTTESRVQVPIRDAGSFTDFYSYVPTNTASVSSTITLRKSLADTAILVTYTADQTGAKTDTDSVAFANTDEANYEVTVPTETGSNSIAISVLSISFVPDTTTNCIAFLVTFGSGSVGAGGALTYYFGPIDSVTSASPSDTTPEADVKYRVRASFTTSDLFTNVSANARTTNSVFSTRKNGGAGGQSVTYTSTQTGQKEDTSGSDSLVAGDDYNYEFVLSTGTETIAFQIISTTCISTANIFPMLMGNKVGKAFSNSTSFFLVDQFLSASSLTETPSQALPNFNFTANELVSYVESNTNALFSFDIFFRDNGADSAITVSYAAAQTGLKNDASNTATITGGSDEVNYSVINNDLTGVVTLNWVGILGNTAVAASTRIPTLLLMGAG